MIGDNYETDIYPALSLGMKTIWVLSRPRRELDSIVRILNSKNPKPHLVVTSIEKVGPCTIKTLASSNSKIETEDFETSRE